MTETEPEYILAYTHRLGDDDLEWLTVLLAWEAADLGCSESLREVLLSIVGQCREIHDGRSITLAVMERKLGQEERPDDV